MSVLQVGLEKMATEHTRLIYMTTGVLLQKLVSTKCLTEYSHIFVDEVKIVLNVHMHSSVNWYLYFSVFILITTFNAAAVERLNLCILFSNQWLLCLTTLPLSQGSRADWGAGLSLTGFEETHSFQLSLCQGDYYVKVNIPPLLTN